VVGAMILGHHPLTSLVLGVFLVLDDPVARVTCLAPPGRQVLGAFCKQVLVYRIDLHVFSELADHIALINAIVDVVVTLSGGHDFLADDH